MIRQNVSFWCWKVRAFRWGEREREKRRREEEEERRRKEEENLGLELWFGTLVFVSMEPMYGFVD